MITIFYSAKGGQGCSVTAAAFALTLASRNTDTALVDLASGDLPAVLGLPEPHTEEARIDVLPHLFLYPAGDAAWDTVISLDQCGFHVVVDLGLVTDPENLPMGSHCSLVMVTRACYISLRRNVALGLKPNRIVLIEEPGRSLRSSDVADVVGLTSDQVTTVACDPAVARAVDAGLLASRVPLVLSRAANLLSEGVMA